ncbi:hypothetical protein [Mycolicibacterium bacteremicum]|uniref:hypothetical protein n=1 Tax=Mycolicibacterium bacteremicum TaxID=564198 RepID=UPI0026F1E016|nr:hypothetical protein [Mycolicibacterium bacteremicum]
MTLVLSAVCGYYVFHASDRLTTVTPTRKNPDRSWDIHANKTIIVCGQDCWLVIGYTGLAYLDNKPTDAFIASVLAGGEDLSSGMGMWFPGRPLHYREITSSIEGAMYEAYKRLPKAVRRYPTIISGVGVQNRKPRHRHVVFEAVITENGVHHRELGDRHQGRYSFQTLPIGSVNVPVFQNMRARLRAEGLESPERFRDIMMDAVAETGSQSDVVGEDVMGVILEPLSGKIRVHFRTADPASQTKLAMMATSGEESASIPNVSTPYILAPGQFFSPAVATGGWSLHPSGVQIELTGFDRKSPDGPMRAYWAKHPRRTQP